MAAAIRRMDPTCSTLTNNHIILVNRCLQMNSTASARSVLDKDISTLVSRPLNNSDMQPPLCTPDLPSSYFIQRHHGLTEAVNLQMVHDYYMFGAICYMDMENWSRAAFFLENVLSTPSKDTGNYPVLEAYKKWVLVKLLQNGKVCAQGRQGELWLRD